MSKPIVLVVDDEPSPRDLACAFIEAAGCEVLSARDPREALPILKMHQVAAVLTDIDMPHMNGPELADKIRQTCPNVNVVFMSGRTKAMLVRDGLLDEAAPFLPKPFYSMAEFKREFLLLAKISPASSSS